VRHLIARLAAAALVVAAAGAGVISTSAPAAAAACSGATGVTVVVDPGSLGGGIAEVCNSSAGGKAASLFSGAGFSLTYVQRQPGFVCRVDGKPASDPCVNTPPADAYWGLWWSDGKSGTWSYSSLGAGSLNVPDGGYVAFAWQSGSKSAPGVPASAHAQTPPTSAAASATPTTKPTTTPTDKPSSKPSTKPSSKPSGKPTSQPTGQTAPTPTGAESVDSAPTSAAPDQTGSASPSATEDASDSASATTPESATESADVSATDTSQAPDPTAQAGETAPVEEDSALPAWVVPAVLVLLAIGGGAAYLLRRRDRPRP
jgi:hypothetical protein